MLRYCHRFLLVHSRPYQAKCAHGRGFIGPPPNAYSAAMASVLPNFVQMLVRSAEAAVSTHLTGKRSFWICFSQAFAPDGIKRLEITASYLTLQVTRQKSSRHEP